MPLQKTNSYIPIEENIPLWRYISFDKYESLLRDNALFFCRADKFSDPYECSLPKKEVEFRASIAKFEMDNELRGVTGVFDSVKAQKHSDAYAKVHQDVRRATTVNCWHVNENESDAMWSLYLKDNEGVAIKTNLSRLSNALNASKINIYGSKVRYINYDTAIFHHPTEFPYKYYSTLTPLFHKKIEFLHEKEFRLFNWDGDREKEGYWGTQSEHKGELIPTDVLSLVETVVFHPKADDSTKSKYRELAEKYGFKFSFETSSLSNQIYY